MMAAARPQAEVKNSMRVVFLGGVSSAIVLSSCGGDRGADVEADQFLGIAQE